MKDFKLNAEEYPGVNIYVLRSLENYVNHGLRPGGFLKAVLCNDLLLAVLMADHQNRNALVSIVELIYLRLPANCYGSEEAFSAHIENAKK